MKTLAKSSFQHCMKRNFEKFEPNITRTIKLRRMILAGECGTHVRKLDSLRKDTAWKNRHSLENIKMDLIYDCGLACIRLAQDTDRY